MYKRRKFRYERLSDRRCTGTLDDFAVLNGFAVERLVTGIVWFQRRAVQVEAGESSLGSAEKENLCVGVTVGGLSISPGSRSIRTDCEPIRKQLRATLLVQRQDHDVDRFAADLNAHAAAFQRDSGGC